MIDFYLKKIKPYLKTLKTTLNVQTIVGIYINYYNCV